MDFIDKSTPHGEFANALYDKNIGALRTFATLPKNAWELLDAAVIKALPEVQVGLPDLYSRNLVRPVNGLASSVVTTQRASKMGKATVSMDLDSQGQADKKLFNEISVPLPVIHSQYYLNTRVIEESKRVGTPIDTLYAEDAARAVGDQMEELLFNGGFQFGNANIYGYTTYPDANTTTITDWTSATGADIVAQITLMIQASVNARHYGPWMLYVPLTYNAPLMGDYKSATDKSLKQRIMELGGIVDIKTSAKLAANTVVLVEMAGSTVKWIEGLPLMNSESPETVDGTGLMNKEFKVYTIGTPQLISDYSGRCGITVGTI